MGRFPCALCVCPPCLQPKGRLGLVLAMEELLQSNNLAKKNRCKDTTGQARTLFDIFNAQPRKQAGNKTAAPAIMPATDDPTVITL